MLTLMTKKREVYGRALEAERTAGWLPAVVYGSKTESVPVFVPLIDFKKILAEAGESTVITISGDGFKKEVLIHDVDYNPLTGAPIHVDFLAVDMNKPIKVHVELEFEGVAPAVKELGGALVKVMHELEVEALPKDLPHNLVVDISVLADFDSQILVKDIKLPAGVVTDTDPEEVVASISQAGEEVVEELAPVDLSAIEVEKKGKKEDEETEA